MYTPTGIAKLSGMGLSVQIVTLRSSSVTTGYIVSILPVAGTTVDARSVVTVDISVNDS
jgi:beta-lactam-binding protein with PASTA domain